MSISKSISLGLLVVMAGCGNLVAQASVPPPKISLPSTLATTATGKTIGGRPWQYVVWQTADYGWLRNRTLSLYIKPGVADAAGSYVLLGTSGVTTDPATLKVLLDRSKTIATEPEETNEATQDVELTSVINSLCDTWKVGLQSLPTNREGKLSALINRAVTSEDDAITLRQVSISHPAVRMALGLGWAGPLPVAEGTTATIEVREYDPIGGRDLQVVGRVTFQAGRPVALTAPERPEQIPDITAEGNMSVKLRWAVGDPLRRQSLQTTGFAVWRLDNAPVGVTPTPTELANGFRLNRYPVDIPKLMTLAEAADFVSDRTTYFSIDRGTNNNPGSSGFAAEGQRYYCVAALDWLGQPGAVSRHRLGYIVKTVPPPVPSGLKVDEIFSGAASANPRYLSLVFDGVASPTDPNATITNRFEIYRGGGPQTTSLSALNSLLPQPALPIIPPAVGIAAIGSKPPATGRIVFDDLALQASPGNLSLSYWYAVRSVHQTPLGDIYSAPSPPAFGTFHDREGPVAPGGSLAMDSPVTVIRSLSRSLETIADGVVTEGRGRWIRLKCIRAGMSDIRSVAFHVVDTTTGLILHSKPKIVFGAGVDEVYTDFFWYDPIVTAPGERRLLTAVCTAESNYGMYSFRQPFALDWDVDGGPSPTQRTIVRFEAKVQTDSQLNVGNVSAAFRMETPAGGYSQRTDGNQVTITFNSSTLVGRKAIIRIVRSGRPEVVRLARVDANRRIVFVDPDVVTFGYPSGGYTLHLRKDIQSPMPVGFTGEVWLPSTKEPGHLSFSPVTGGSPSLWINIQVSPGAAEYRIYRQVDGGTLGLIAEGPCNDTLQDGYPPQVVVEDKPNIPVTAMVCYFAQLIDSSGNPGPLKQIGEYVPAIGPLPIPVVDTPEQLGTVGSPQMKVKWFSTKAGVSNFQVRVYDKATGAVLPTPAGGVKLPVTASNGVYFDKPLSGNLPNINTDTPIYVMSFLETPPGAVPPVAEEPAVFSLTYSVKADTEYGVEVRAVSWNGSVGTPGLAQNFTWRSQVASGSVPWPARPLPPVIDGAPFGISAVSVTNAFRLLQGPIQYYNLETLPVFVTIGIVPLAPTNGFGQEQLPSPGTTVPSGPYIPSLLADTSDSRFRGVHNPNGYIFSVPNPVTKLMTPVTSVVLYRQLIATQGRDTSQTADLIQVSPLIQSIAWLPRPGNRQGIVDQNVVAFPIHTGSEYDSARLGIADLHPILNSSTYRYFLVQFDADGEILQTIDAGTITTPAP